MGMTCTTWAVGVSEGRVVVVSFYGMAYQYEEAWPGILTSALPLKYLPANSASRWTILPIFISWTLSETYTHPQSKWSGFCYKFRHILSLLTVLVWAQDLGQTSDSKTGAGKAARHWIHWRLLFYLTFSNGRTTKAPPPAASVMMATYLGFTEQNVASHELFVIRILSYDWSLFTACPKTWRNLLCRTTRKDIWNKIWKSLKQLNLVYYNLDAPCYELLV